MNEVNENNSKLVFDFMFSIINTVNINITPTITEYSAINDSKAFLLCIPNVQKIPITTAIKIANNKFAIFEDNA